MRRVVVRARGPQAIMTQDGKAEKLGDTLGVRVPDGTAVHLRRKNGRVTEMRLHHEDGHESRAVADPDKPDSWTTTVTSVDSEEGTAVEHVVGTGLSKDDLTGSRDWARRPEEAFDAGKPITQEAADVVQRAMNEEPPRTLPKLLGLARVDEIDGVVVKRPPDAGGVGPAAVADLADLVGDDAGEQLASLIGDALPEVLSEAPPDLPEPGGL